MIANDFLATMFDRLNKNALNELIQLDPCSAVFA